MLRMHMKTHEKENKLPTCSICSKEFKSKSILYRHRATHFTNQKQHRCSQCEKNFSSNYQLNQHMQRHKKNHQCTDCQKSFVSAADLKVKQIIFNNLHYIPLSNIFLLFSLISNNTKTELNWTTMRKQAKIYIRITSKYFLNIRKI